MTVCYYTAFAYNRHNQPSAGCFLNRFGCLPGLLGLANAARRLIGRYFFMFLQVYDFFEGTVLQSCGED